VGRGDHAARGRPAGYTDSIQMSALIKQKPLLLVSRSATQAAGCMLSLPVRACQPENLETRDPRPLHRIDASSSFPAHPDCDLPGQFRALRDEHLSLGYLDDLLSAVELSPQMSLVQLIVTPEELTVQAGRKLRERREAEASADGARGSAAGRRGLKEIAHWSSTIKRWSDTCGALSGNGNLAVHGNV